MLIGALVLAAALDLVVVGLLLIIRHEIQSLRFATSRNSRDIRDNSQDIRDSNDLVATTSVMSCGRPSQRSQGLFPHSKRITIASRLSSSATCFGRLCNRPRCWKTSSLE